MRRFLTCAIAIAAPGCAAVPTLPGVTPHRIEIQQGNYVSQEMIAQLKPGMTREQVRFVLGTPLVTDIFHADRWDYVYYRDVPNRPREQRRISIFFEDGKFVRIGGDVVPATPAPAAGVPKAAPAEAPKPRAAEVEKPPVAELAKPAAPDPAAEAEKPAATSPERGFFGRMLDKLRGSE